MTQEMKQLLSDLADVLEKHKAGLGYTTWDDGVRVYLNSESVSVEFPEDGDVRHIRGLIL